jgi:GNAT superfamily N-acetyltransferase
LLTEFLHRTGTYQVGPVTTTAAERAERDTHRDLVRALPRAAIEAGRIDVLEFAGAVCTCMSSDPSLAAWNRVIGLGVDAPPTPQILDRIEAFYARRAAGFAVQGTVAGIEERGYAREPGTAVFARAAQPIKLPETSFTISDAQNGQEFGALCAAASRLPHLFASWFAELVGRDHWHCFLAHTDGTPVATGALYAAESVGCLGLAATRQEERGRGAQRALLAARLERARDLGLSTVVASTGEPVRGAPAPSYRNLERTGFQLVGVRPSWRRTP